MKRTLFSFCAALSLLLLFTACPGPNVPPISGKVKSIVYDNPGSIQMTLDFFYNRDGSIAEVQRISRYYYESEISEPDTVSFRYLKDKDSMEIRFYLPQSFFYKTSAPIRTQPNGNIRRMTPTLAASSKGTDGLYFPFLCKLNPNGYIASMKDPFGLIEYDLSMKYDQDRALTEYTAIDGNDKFTLAAIEWGNGNPTRIDADYLIIDLQYGENPRKNNTGINPILLALEIEEYLIGMPIAAVGLLGESGADLPQSATYDHSEKEIFTYDFDQDRLLKITSSYIEADGKESSGRSIRFIY